MMQINKQAGYTLVEIFIAAFIGLFLSAAVIQTYLSTRTTFDTTRNINRIQEDSRFLFSVFTDDVRGTSALGCHRTIRDMSNVNPVSDLTIKLAGWDFQGTSPDDVVQLTDTYVIGNQGDWLGLNDGGSNQLPSSINSVINSDVILVKEIVPLPGATVVSNSSNNSIVINGYTPSLNETLIVGNCLRADKFLSAGVDPNNVSAVSGRSFQEDWGPSAQISRVRYNFYYVGLANGNTVPSFYRIESSVYPINLTNTPAQELVENVENMQILYGLDTDGTGFANRYISARDVGSNWPQVVSIRAGFLFVSENGKSLESGSGNDQFNLAGDITFEAPTTSDDLRYVSTLTVNTRNLGLSEDFSVCLASNTASTCSSLGYVVTTP